MSTTKRAQRQALGRGRRGLGRPIQRSGNRWSLAAASGEELRVVRAPTWGCLGSRRLSESDGVPAFLARPHALRLVTFT